MVTQEQLKSLISYNPENGDFSWLSESLKKRYEFAGTKRYDGYVTIAVMGRRYFAHRLAWLYVFGEFPRYQIDHIDRCKSNNSISNLREATPTQNLANRRLNRNKCGFRGVWEVILKSKVIRYVACAKINSVKYHLGTFSTPEEAHAAYVIFMKDHHGEYFAI